MQDETASEVRQRATDHFVCLLFFSGNRRSRSSLRLISLHGVREKTAAQAADRLADEGLLDREDGIGESFFTISEAGRVALRERGAYLQGAS